MSPSIKIESANRIDGAMRFFIYLLIFWVPYSTAVVEVSVVSISFLWWVKRWFSFDWSNWRGSRILNKVRQFGEAFKPFPSFLNRAIFVFLAVSVISAMNSSLQAQSLQSVITKIFEWFIVYFITIEVFSNQKHIWIACGILFFTAFSTGVDALLQFYITNKDLFFQHVTIRGGATAAFKHPNSLGAYLAVIVPSAFSLFWLKKRYRWQYPFVIVLLTVVSWALIVTFSRAAWLATFIGIIILLVFIKKKIGFWLALGMIFFTVFIGAFLPYRIIEKTRFDWNEISDATTWRKDVWEDSFKMIQEKPWLGHGPNTFMSLFQEYRRRYNGGDINPPTYAHNCYLQILVEEGVLGTAAFLWVIGNFLFTVGNMLWYEKSYSADLRIVLQGLYCGGIAFLVHSFFDTDFYSLQLSVYFWELVAIMTAIYHLCLQSDARQQENDSISYNRMKG